MWRDPPPGSFIIKVSPQNNGSQHLVVITEELPPGGKIPRHKHLGQDEMVLVESGTLHFHIGDKRRDLHAGGLAFIPAYTWVNITNNSHDPAALVAIFSAPGFENHLRCVSVLMGERASPLTPLTPQERKQCDVLGRVEYKSDRAAKATAAPVGKTAP